MSIRENNIVFLLAGQGSQYYHMGDKLYEHEKIFKFWVDKANNHIINKYNLNILSELYNNQRAKHNRFDNILYTHPSIFIIEYALFQLLLSKNIFPNYLIGGSLGEFIALVLSGCLSFEEALDLIIEKTFFIKQNFPIAKMIAIFHDHSVFNNEIILKQNTEIVSINLENHFAVCCRTEVYKDITTWLELNSILYQEISINRAFHTSLIDGLQSSFYSFLTAKQRNFLPLRIPVISCIDCTIKDSVNIKYLWDIIRQPIKFYNLMKQYEHTILNKSILIDLSPSGTYAAFARHCLTSNNKIFSILTPFENSNNSLNKTILHIKNYI